MARRPTKQERQIAALLEKLAPQVRAAFIEAIRAAATAVDRAALIAALEAGNIGAALDMLRMNQQALFPVGEAVRTAYLQGGASIAASLPIALRGQFGFGGNPRAVSSVQRIVGQMIEGIEAESLDAVRGYITQAVDDGMPPRSISLELTGRLDKITGKRTGGLLGLNGQQTDAAIRARAELNALDDRYFTRTLRDKRFDATVRKAISDGKALSQGQIDKIAGRYKDRLLAHRGEVIARTETLNALRAGQHDGFGQLIDTGAVAPERLTVKWLATSDERTRDAHVSLGGTVVKFGELFQSQTGGLLAHPGDRGHGAGAADLVQCFHPSTMVARSGLLSAMRRDYAGELIELSVGGGVSLTVTPNHPVLTGRGWVQAGKVKEGDNLFNCAFRDVGAGPAGPDVEGMEATAEELYNSAEALCAPVRADRGIVDFHGDIPDKDVDVVAMQRGLGFAFDPASHELIDNHLFALADVSEGLLLAARMEVASDGPFAYAAGGMVRGLGSTASLVWAHQGSTAPVAFGDSWRDDTHVFKAPLHHRPANSDPLGDSQDREPVAVAFLHQGEIWPAISGGAGGGFPAVDIASRAVDRLDAKVFEAGSNDRLSKPGFAADIEDASRLVAGSFHGGEMGRALFGPTVNAVRVMHVRRFRYEGFVYNFESVSNVLVANGIVNHNCRCAAVYRILPKVAP